MSGALAGDLFNDSERFFVRRFQGGDELSETSFPNQRSPDRARGIDKPFLVEQFIGRLKAHLAQMQCDLTENVELDVVVGFFLPVKPLLWKSWAMPTRHSSRLAAGCRGAEGLHVPGSSIIDRGPGLDRIDFLRISVRRVVTFEAR